MPYAASWAGAFFRYVAAGDEAAFENARKQAAKQDYGIWFLRDAWPHLAAPGQLSDEEKRAMRGAVVLGDVQSLIPWLKRSLKQESADEELALTEFVSAFGAGAAARVPAAVVLVAQCADCLQRPDGQPNVAGRFLLALSDKELSAAGEKAGTVSQSLEFLLRCAPQRVPMVAPSFLCEGSDKYRSVSTKCCQILLAADANLYEPAIARQVAAERRLGPKADALEVLAEHFPEKYLQQTRAAHLTILADEEYSSRGPESCRWLAAHYGPAILPAMAPFLDSTSIDYAVRGALKALVETLGQTATPVVLAALQHPSDEVRLEALSILVGRPNPEFDTPIRVCLETGLIVGNVNDLIRYIGLAGRWQPKAVAAALWKLVDHKSKPVRQAVARALAKLGDDAVEKAGELLTAKKAATRSTAVTLLADVQSPAAAAALEARLDAETDEEVRDQILLALEQVWESQGRAIGRADIDGRIERVRDKLKAAIVPWLADEKLPPLDYRGEPRAKLSREAVRYLLYRQSRTKQMRADVEAKPLFALIDRQTSGDFGLAVLRMFCSGPMAAEDRWALVVAGLLGDDRVVPLLMQQIRTWVDNGRGKLAEYAAESLALLGTDAALCAVDSLSIRYRSKQKNIGKAASEAFAEAAERLGMTVDELGDRVVPWLGFESGQPRRIEHGEKTIEIRIGPDFKIELRDLAKGKTIGSLPAGFPAEMKSELKDLGATLREVLKGQFARLENLMVRQFRWPIARWRELYLAHPVLIPFAARLVWGRYGADGKLSATFRALEDLSLTNNRDEPVELPGGAASSDTIGIVHPLELSSDERRAWAVHLADYQIRPPFLQMERSVVFPAAADRNVKLSSKYDATELNAMTFKGRAERLGWQRGSVVDAGGISSYRKCFPGAGADAILGLDGMYIGVDMYTNIKLQRFCFVKTGSVSTGSYIYDEPNDDSDQRLIPFAEVPPIVFSETLGDLAKIAGQTEAAAEEAAAAQEA